MNSANYAVSKQSGAQIEHLPLSKDLQIDVEKTEYLFSIKKPSVVVLNALSNVTGYVTPAKEIFSLAKRYGAITALDAAQAAGLLDLDMQMLQADNMWDSIVTDSIEDYIGNLLDDLDDDLFREEFF